jgi:hypothetical protein
MILIFSEHIIISKIYPKIIKLNYLQKKLKINLKLNFLDIKL